MPVIFCTLPEIQPRHPSSDLVVLTNLHAFSAYFSSSSAPEVEGVILLAELTWERASYSSFGGLRLIQRLRLEYKYWGPILVTSMVPISGFSTFEQDVSAPDSMGFGQDPFVFYVDLHKILPEAPQDLLLNLPFDDCEEMDDHLRKDLESSIYSSTGFIAEEIHRLFSRIKRRWYGKTLDGQVMNTLIQGSFNRLEDLFPEHALFLTQKKEDILREITPLEVMADKLGVLDKLLGEIEEKLTKWPEMVLPVSEVEQKKVLLIDDDPQDGEVLKNELDKYRIKAYLVKDFATAFETLSRHPDLFVILFDYRFYDQYGRIAPHQGYHYLKKLRAGFDRDLYFISLSFYSPYFQNNFLDKYLDKYFDKRGIYSKEGGIERLVRVIIEQQQKAEMYRQQVAQPDFDTTYFRYYWGLKQEVEKFQSVEEKISRIAKEYVLAVKGEEPLNDLPIIEGITTNFDIPQKDPQTHAYVLKKMDAFIQILKARRVVLGLLRLPLVEMFSIDRKSKVWRLLWNIVKKQQYDLEEEDSSFGKFWSKHLMLPRQRVNYQTIDINQLPITIEEREWLRANQSLFYHE
jgi:CheY-like chemotaxis protein